jgi:hypothetical protein
MGFESVRGYVELASGLSDLTRSRAKEAAQGLLSIPAAGIATGGKMAVQVSALADELLAAATANRSSLTMLVRSEVDIAINRLGLVPVQRLDEAQAETARLRVEVARLRSASAQTAVSTGPAKEAAAPRGTGRKVAAPKTTAKAVAPKNTAKKAAGLTAKAATKSAANVATRSTAKAVTKPAAKKVTRSAVKTATKPAAKKMTRSAVKTATKPAAKASTAARSAVTTRAKPAGA